MVDGDRIIHQTIDGNRDAKNLPVTYDSLVAAHTGVLANLRKFWGRRSLIRIWLTSGIRSGYKQTWFGLMWSLFGPLTNSLVYTVIFSIFLNVKTDGEASYTIFVYLGVLTWSYFSSFLTRSGATLIGTVDLMTKAVFPREMLILTSLADASITLGIGLIVGLFLIVFSVNSFNWTIILFPFLLLIQIVMMLGLGLLLSATAVLFRDITRLVPLILQLGFYFTPIVYPVSRVPDNLQSLYKLNPMTTLIVAYRDVLLEGKTPEWGYVGFVFILAIALFFFGYSVFKRLEWRFVDVL